MATRALAPTTNENIFWVGSKGLEAADNQVIVLQDKFVFGSECPACGDKEHRFKEGTSGETKQTESIVDCENCLGLGKYKKGENEISCTFCARTGKVACPTCAGKGTLKGIVLSEEQKDGRPTTGTVVSAGCNVKKYVLGDRVLVPSFAGHGLDLAGVNLKTGEQEEADITILVENDILAKVHGGVLERKSVKKSMALHTAS